MQLSHPRRLRAAAARLRAAQAGTLPITSISAADVERALSELIGQRTRQGSGTLSPRSIRHVWNTLRIGVGERGWFGHPSVG